MSQLLVALRYPETDEPVWATVEYKTVKAEQLYAIQEGVEKFRTVYIPEVTSVEYRDDNENVLELSFKESSVFDDEIVSQLFWETSK